MSDANRTRIFRKPVWLVVVLLLPVIGPLLWIFMGKGPVPSEASAPDNDTDYLRSIGNDREHDARIAELEEEMRKLDDEIAQARRTSMDQHPSNHTGAVPTLDATSPDVDPDATDLGAGDLGEPNLDDTKGKGPDQDSEGTRS
jgi:cytoskeletal protein RodZ